MDSTLEQKFAVGEIGIGVAMDSLISADVRRLKARSLKCPKTYFIV